MTHVKDGQREADEFQSDSLIMSVGLINFTVSAGAEGIGTLTQRLSVD